MIDIPWNEEELRLDYDDRDFYGDEELDEEPELEFYDA